MSKSVFTHVRRDLVTAVLAAAGAAGALTACSSYSQSPGSGATYGYDQTYSRPGPARPTAMYPQPAPMYPQPAPQPAYGSPAATPVAPPAGGQMQCGKGRCG